MLGTRHEGVTGAFRPVAGLVSAERPSRRRRLQLGDGNLVKRYEGFTVEHARLCDDARTRVDRGGSRPTDADREFVRVFEQHLDEQPLALAHAAASA
jgi:hypothetical protein